MIENQNEVLDEETAQDAQPGTHVAEAGLYRLHVKHAEDT